MKISFLHLSDLHFRSEWPEELGKVTQGLFQDLEHQLSRFENVHLIFSGDFVNAGNNQKSYADLLELLDSGMSKIGIGKEKRICVPGNHDISRDALRDKCFLHKGALALTTNERSFNERLSQLSSSVFLDKFKMYSEFESKFSDLTCNSSGLGGRGWKLNEGLGVYNLNTAICSYGGMSESGEILLDRENLSIDSRNLNKWIQESDDLCRILVMHHPLEWLTEWAKLELESLINKHFMLVYSGHVHKGSSTFSSRGQGKSIYISAPPLFTNKSNLLGYSITVLDTISKEVRIHYRQWTPSYAFVTGTSFSNNDSGIISFFTSESQFVPIEVLSNPPKSMDTRTILQAEFDKSREVHSTKKLLWVERDLSNYPETHARHEDLKMTTPKELAFNVRNCFVRAPKEFGLSCMAHFMALEHHKNCKHKVLAVVDAAEVPSHRQGVIGHVKERCAELDITEGELDGIILDNWSGDRSSMKALKIFKTEFPALPVIVLHGVSDYDQIASSLEINDIGEFEILYLWALTRNRIRELVTDYISDLDSLDENLVTDKVASDIDALNIHRTPHNCLLLLKLVSQAFDDSPVNRTEMISRVLTILFIQYNRIPNYETRPDLKDSEFALGYFTEWLIKIEKSSFSKQDFIVKVREYCSLKLLLLDVDQLFTFLISEKIFIAKHADIEFRFSYWLYYFAAHRMHHDSEFAGYILGDMRYAAFPEIIEFYTGIDRQRRDAIIQLTNDLKAMNAAFLERTQIPEDFNPLENAVWSPSDDILAQLKHTVEVGMEESSLSVPKRDEIADASYDKAKPYKQSISQFLSEASLRQMVQAMKGAARALRNSDHVAPEEKKALLEEVLLCWKRMAQALIIVSPLLAEQRTAGFEGMGFILGPGFDRFTTSDRRWMAIMFAISDNVVRWYQEDIFSRKMGILLSNYIDSHHGELGELFAVLVVIHQRPLGWADQVERFILRQPKHSFYLQKVFGALVEASEIGIIPDRIRKHLKRLAAMSLAKHSQGIMRPNEKVVKKISDAMEERKKAAS